MARAALVAALFLYPELLWHRPVLRVLPDSIVIPVPAARVHMSGRVLGCQTVPTRVAALLLFRIERVASALDSVRRTGHQQLGRFEKLCVGGRGRGGGFSGFVRQHKDDFIFILHGVVTIMLRFRDYDGALQSEAC